MLHKLHDCTLDRMILHEYSGYVRVSSVYVAILATFMQRYVTKEYLYLGVCILTMECAHIHSVYMSILTTYRVIHGVSPS